MEATLRSFKKLFKRLPLEVFSKYEFNHLLIKLSNKLHFHLVKESSQLMHTKFVLLSQNEARPRALLINDETLSSGWNIDIKVTCFLYSMILASFLILR